LTNEIWFSNLSLLRSAKVYAKNLKAIAVTGSINACTTGAATELHNLTNSTYNSIAQSEARSGSQFIRYCSAKKEAELAVWNFVKEEKPAFGVTVLLPALIFGPPIQPIKSVKRLNFSAGYFYALFNGTLAGKDCTKTMFPAYIDARDLAVAHVRALTTLAAHGKRYLIGGERWMNSHAVDTIRELVKKGELPRVLEEKLPKTPGEDLDVPVAEQVGAKEANEVLGMEGEFRTFEDMVRDFVERILELEKREGL
jgi:nucleoside-diphosphate-sugar epimerase